MNRNFSIFSICLRTLEQHNVHTLNNCFKVNTLKVMLPKNGNALLFINLHGESNPA